ncbi:MAG: hypothetical protein K2X81_21410 [Candidatus Obscuribacterales bacterium]|nr:hypothetical protein [Candidatus Obscuribacterales bacterium]
MRVVSSGFISAFLLTSIVLSGCQSAPNLEPPVDYVGARYLGTNKHPASKVRDYSTIDVMAKLTNVKYLPDLHFHSPKFSSALEDSLADQFCKLVPGFTRNALLNEFGAPGAIESAAIVFDDTSEVDEFWIYDFGYNGFPVVLGMKNGCCISAIRMIDPQYDKYRQRKYEKTREELLGKSVSHVERILGDELMFENCYSIGPAGFVDVTFENGKCKSVELPNLIF